jgi:hypothetical protein
MSAYRSHKTSIFIFISGWTIQISISARRSHKIGIIHIHIWIGNPNIDINLQITQNCNFPYPYLDQQYKYRYQLTDHIKLPFSISISAIQISISACRWQKIAIFPIHIRTFQQPEIFTAWKWSKAWTKIYSSNETKRI